MTTSAGHLSQLRRQRPSGSACRQLAPPPPLHHPAHASRPPTGMAPPPAPPWLPPRPRLQSRPPPPWRPSAACPGACWPHRLQKQHVRPQQRRCVPSCLPCHRSDPTGPSPAGGPAPAREQGRRRRCRPGRQVPACPPPQRVRPRARSRCRCLRHCRLDQMTCPARRPGPPQKTSPIAARSRAAASRRRQPERKGEPVQPHVRTSMKVTRKRLPAGDTHVRRHAVQQPLAQACQRSAHPCVVLFPLGFQGLCHAVLVLAQALAAAGGRHAVRE